MFRTISPAADDSILLALEALREGRDREAHESAYEAWGLHHSPQAAAIGLADAVEIPRWICRRRSFKR
jgi:hypothetical protein